MIGPFFPHRNHAYGTASMPKISGGSSGESKPWLDADGSYNFDGSDDYVSWTQAAWQTWGSWKTLAGWVKFNGLSNQVVAHRSDLDVNGWYILFNSSGQFTVCTGNGVVYAATSSATSLISAGTWYHVAFVKNGDNSQVSVYINGVDRTSSHADHSGYNDLAGQMIFAENVQSLNAKTCEWFVSTAALTVAQLQAIAGKSWADGINANIVSAWSMDDGTGVVCVDAVGANDGAISQDLGSGFFSSDTPYI